MIFRGASLGVDVELDGFGGVCPGRQCNAQHQGMNP
jgi:hypothetical protein